jgi:nicotinate-nucleotide--dimethylbenzimidazole phosphoribosyltransferase
MREQVEAWVSGEGEISQEIAALDCDLRLYDLGTERPTADSRLGPAMTEAEACLAASYGMMAVEPGLDLLALAAIGSGAALAGTLISGALGDADPLAALAALGGPDIAAMLGAILAARLAGIPVILDGAAAHAAAEIAGALRPDAIDHCRSATRGTSLDAILRDQHETPLAGVRALAALMALHSPS